MNIALRNVLTVPEYLAWAEAQPEKVRAELINGHIVPMASEKAIHNRLKSYCYVALAQAFKATGQAGEVMADGMTVPIDTYTAYEPDVVLYLGAPIADARLTVPDPVVVVEVLSPTSRHTDRSAKLAGYFTLPSVMHYLIVDPDTRSLTHHRRQEDGAITATTHTAGMLRLDPPGLAVDLADVLRG
ncbi:MAG: Uma2 family endonuclease [Hyphomicrobiaceae bacterium]|nr:Uma2 family endonuclease [Hyphomicrobiaceae bacterium]